MRLKPNAIKNIPGGLEYFLLTALILLPLVLLAACNSVEPLVPTSTPANTAVQTKPLAAPPSVTSTPSPTSTTAFPTRTPTPVIDDSVQHALQPEDRYTFTPAPTRTPTPSRTPVLTETGRPSPTPTMMVSWADWFPAPVVLDRFHGQWSPAYNEMVSGYRPTGDKNYSIAVATAPDFAIKYFDLGDIAVELTWGPDGRHILFGAGNPVMPSVVDEQNNYLWVVDRKGVNAHWVGGDTMSFRFLDFGGWMSEWDIVISSYHGMGYDVSAVDYRIGSETAFGQSRGVLFTPNANYVPNLCVRMNGTAQVIALSKSGFFGNCDSGEDYRLAWIAQQGINTTFIDWLPGTNRMLISAFTFDTNILALDTYTGAMPQRSHLLLWGVDTDTLQLLVPNGVGGSFFSDGETLAAITLGQAQLDEMGRFAAPSGKQIQPEDHPYLYLLDMDSQKVSLGLPVHTFSGALEYIQLQGWADAAGIPFWYPDYSLGDPFSPDNRFLAILTPGKVINNEKGQPVDVETDLQNALYLNILDLQTLKVIHSVPTWDEKPLWSPKSERVLYREPDGNWSLLEIASGETRPITLSGGEDFERAAWSHDGRYLALYRHRQTVIILVSP